MKSNEDILFFQLKTFVEPSGNLIPIENSDLPFNMKRIFYVYGAPINQLRGAHAHKKTNQLLIAINGSCEVVCDDLNKKKKFKLDSPKKALFIPSTLWAHQIYKEEGTILMVLCDRKYEEKDYIRSFDIYKKYRRDL